MWYLLQKYLIIELVAEKKEIILVLVYNFIIIADNEIRPVELWTLLLIQTL